MDFIVMPAAERFIKKIKKSDKALFQKYREAIDKICEDPTIGEMKHCDLEGYYGYDINHNKTSYELSYIIGKNKSGQLVIVIMAGTRENFYEELKNYIKQNKTVINNFK